MLLSVSAATRWGHMMGATQRYEAAGVGLWNCSSGKWRRYYILKPFFFGERGGGENLSNFILQVENLTRYLQSLGVVCGCCRVRTISYQMHICLIIPVNWLLIAEVLVLNLESIVWVSSPVGQGNMCNGTWGFVTVFTRSHHWDLPRVNWMQSAPSHPIALKIPSLVYVT